jgi:hypothetical protein
MIWQEVVLFAKFFDSSVGCFKEGWSSGKATIVDNNNLERF